MIRRLARAGETEAIDLRTRREVTAEKLRGGYYTPPRLVEFCLQRAAPLLADRKSITMLEPSVGDGAFLRGLARTRSGLGGKRVAAIYAIELIAEEAAKAELSMRSSGHPGCVERGSALRWAAETDQYFDLVLGNPPFVRYQFVPQDDKQAIVRLADRLGIRFGGVANLWIPLLLGALARLRPGGAATLVLPTECFTGLSARAVREWLTRNLSDLAFDLFPPGSFPGVLQEVAVMSGRRTAEPIQDAPEILINEHRRSGGTRCWTHRPKASDQNWTRSLIDPPHLEALTAACALPEVTPLRQVARLEVSIVTGANGFFCVDQQLLRRFDLQTWARPLLARSRYSPGLVFDASDHANVTSSGATAWLLDFSAGGPDPTMHEPSRRYLELGVELGLPARYKCRIREPWYRVPSIRTGSLFLSKRSHLFPRLMLNDAQAFTTDTIYRGSPIASSRLAAEDLVCAFHSSLTLLTVEIEGRSFGGGVLELVPSEIARLAVVARPGLRQHLSHLDHVARSEDPEALVRETDLLLERSRLVPGDLLAVLAEARLSLLARRLDRNIATVYDAETIEARAA